MGRSNDSLKKRVEKLLRISKDTCCYKRDYKKEGLTRPNEVLQLTLETLEEKYPGKFAEFFVFLRYSLILDKDITNLGKAGETVHPIRGTGLGMMNELVTLIALAKEEIVYRRIERETGKLKIRKRIHSGIWNDDSIFAGKHKYVDLFRQFDIEINDQLDYIINLDKSVIMRNAGWILAMASSDKYDANYDYFFRLIIWSKANCKNVEQLR